MYGKSGCIGFGRGTRYFHLMERNLLTFMDMVVSLDFSETSSRCVQHQSSV